MTTPTPVLDIVQNNTLCLILHDQCWIPCDELDREPPGNSRLDWEGQNPLLIKPIPGSFSQLEQTTLQTLWQEALGEITTQQRGEMQRHIETLKGRLDGLETIYELLQFVRLCERSDDNITQPHLELVEKVKTSLQSLEPPADSGIPLETQTGGRSLFSRLFPGWALYYEGAFFDLIPERPGIDLHRCTSDVLYIYSGRKRNEERLRLLLKGSMKEIKATYFAALQQQEKQMRTRIQAHFTQLAAPLLGPIEHELSEVEAQHLFDRYENPEGYGYERQESGYFAFSTLRKGLHVTSVRDDFKNETHILSRDHRLQRDVRCLIKVQRKFPFTEGCAFVSEYIGYPHVLLSSSARIPSPNTGYIYCLGHNDRAQLLPEPKKKGLPFTLQNILQVAAFMGMEK